MGVQRPKSLNLDHLIEVSESTVNILRGKKEDITTVLDNSSVLALIMQEKHKQVKDKIEGWQKAYKKGEIEYEKIV